MSLLAPLFLIGLVTVALPLWLHRLQTQSADRKPFSSAMLLEAARQQVHVRKRLKYLALLAARITLLALLAVAFAKPVIELPQVPLLSGAAGTHVVLVDTSASMARAGVFDQAIAEARRAIDDAPADALIQVLAADRDVDVVGELGSDKGALRAALSSLSPGALRLDYGEAMTVVERFAAALPPPVTLHLISDFQQSGMPARFADVVPAGIQSLVPHPVGTGEPFNWSVNTLRETRDGVEATLNGAGAVERIADVDLLVNDVVVDTRGMSPTGPQVEHFGPLPFQNGENRVVLRIHSDDDLEADNVAYQVVDRAPPAAVPLVTDAPGGLPLTYVSAALDSAGRWRVAPQVAGNFDRRVLARYRWAIVEDVGLIDAEQDEALTAYVRDGGNLLVFAGERAAALPTLPITGHRIRPAAVAAGPDGTFLGIGQVDTRHPALARTEGWQSVTVTRNLPLEALADDEVLIRLSNNEPWLIERRIGAGRVLLVPAALDNRWSDLPSRPVFVGFMIGAARYLSGSTEFARSYIAGALLPLALAGTASGQVVDPEGKTVLSLADTTREQQVRMDKPGFYEVYTPQGQTTIAVNVDPRESDLHTIGDEVLGRWQNAADGQLPAARVAGVAAETASIELWHWVLLLLAAIVIGESVLGNMYLALRRTGSA